MNDAYFKWILDKVEIDSYRKFEYKKLCKWLFAEPFVWLIRNDENRSADGIEMRFEYIRCGGNLSDEELNKPCSVLEMLAGLSVRCDRDIMGDPDVYRGGKLFWIMVKNLGLDAFNDANFDEEKVAEIVDIWLKRQFRDDGKGSIFYVKNHVKNRVRNQKNIEIWFQMCDFLNENFDFSW